MTKSTSPTSAPTPAPTPAPAPSTDLQTAAAVAAANGNAPTTPEPREYPDKAYVRSKGGDMLHLFQNVVISSAERKIDIDGFARAQLDAGKWEIVNT